MAGTEAQLSSLFLYGGIALMAAAVIGGIIAGVALRMSGRKLEAKLEKEFGKRRR